MDGVPGENRGERCTHAGSWGANERANEMAVRECCYRRFARTQPLQVLNRFLRRHRIFRAYVQNELARVRWMTTHHVGERFRPSSTNAVVTRRVKRAAACNVRQKRRAGGADCGGKRHGIVVRDAGLQ